MARVRQFANDLRISKNQAQNLINKGRSRKDGGSQILENTMKPVKAKKGKSMAMPKKKPNRMYSNDPESAKKTSVQKLKTMGVLERKDKTGKDKTKIINEDFSKKVMETNKKNTKNIKKKEGGATDFGMLSVKAGIDKNPKATQADRIAGAKMKKKPIKARDGASVNKEFPEPETTTAEFRIEMVPEEYRESFRKKFMGNRGEASRKTKKKEKIVQRSKGGGIAVQGLGFKGVR
jgi:hypothetical protein